MTMTEMGNKKSLKGKTKSLNVHDTFWQISLIPSHDQCSQTNQNGNAKVALSSKNVVL